MMKFKQQEQNEENPKINKALYDGFIDLIQFEIDKLTTIESAADYFRKIGNEEYAAFLYGLTFSCKQVKKCFIDHVTFKGQELPEFTIPKHISSFSDNEEPFALLAKMEDEYEKKINALVDIAYEDRDWSEFAYLLRKLENINHLFCKALEIVKNKGSLNTLCELRSMESW